MAERNCQTCRRCVKRDDGYYHCSMDGEKLSLTFEGLKNKSCFYYGNKNEPTLMNYFGW